MITLVTSQHTIITCPNCYGQETLEISQGYSQHLYRCPSCSIILKPRSGDCCIFCSFGSQDCSSAEQNLAA
ncbi:MULTISPECIES: GDCCVxC domain-containing (seleno)protein [unclassified Polynucleobacter]|uniref:GDCCVxC domain-containing (seleno)protein n=1 Tax=unclassified Polynucleobacter TaxID=2640945 RepID=UPI00272CA5E3|nr:MULTISPECIES: GDCCVxC domain-containing (seleno)protein [unclassified Polynucleobacter]